MQSRFYDVAEAGSELTYSGNSQDLPFSFYEELVRGNDIESDDRLKDTDIDNVVLDLSTVLSGYHNHSWSSEFDIGEDRVYRTLDNVFGSDLAYHWESNDEDFTEGSFHDEVGTREIFRSIAELSDIADVYYPDHMEDGLRAARNNHLSDLKSQGFSSYQEFIKKKDDFNKFCSQIITALNEEAIELHAMRDAGMYEEASNGYDSNSFRSLHFTEDDVIQEAAEDLEGNTVIATFDTDFQESGLNAFPPHLIEQIWK
jgi:hypothetical protein